MIDFYCTREKFIHKNLCNAISVIFSFIKIDWTSTSALINHVTFSPRKSGRFLHWPWPQCDLWPTSVTVTSRLSPSPAASPPPLLLRMFSTTVLVICGISRHTSSASCRHICFSSTSVIPAIQMVSEAIVIQFISTLPLLYYKIFPHFLKELINLFNIC